MGIRSATGMRGETLLVVLVLPIILLSETLSYRSLHRYEIAEASALRTRQFLFPWTNLQLDLRRADAARSGYLLTRRAQYLRPFQELLPKMRQELADVERFSSTDPVQTKRLAEIRRLLEQKMEELQATIKMAQSGRSAEAIAELNSDSEEILMTRIFGLMQEVRQAERGKLAEQNSAAGSQARTTFAVNLSGDLALLLFLGFVVYRIERESRRRAQDQEAIRVLNRRLSLELKERTDVLESIQDGFCAFDAEARLIYSNPAAELIFESGHNQFVGESVFEIFGAEAAPEIRPLIERSVTRLSAATAELFVPLYGKWFRIRVYPGADRGFTIYFTDLTEEKQGQEERRLLSGQVEEARVFLDTFFENAPASFGVWDRDLRFLRVNRAFAESDGIPAADHLGKRLEVILPDLAPEVTATIRNVIEQGVSAIGLEVSGTTSNQPGKRRTWKVYYYPIRIGDRIVGAGGIWDEITERKTIEENMRQSAKLESLGVLAGGIAHDFNNLLTGILGNASLASESISVESPARTALTDVVLASERAAHLTRQLLAYAGKGRFVMETVDLSKLVREISALVRMSIPRNAELSFELLENPPGVLADASQIQQLVMNLVINGAEAIPEERRGSVTIRTGVQQVDQGYIRQSFNPGEIEPGTYVFLEVQDTGGGMDEATQARIFDPFFTTKFTGRGLGLAAVVGIVQGHKGAMRVRSTLGQGATFRILLPATEEVAQNPVQSDLSIERSIKAAVLVIDDEDIVRKTAKAGLERHGFTVVVAENGREGLELLKVLKEKISIVLLDLTMPIMSGEETLREIHDLRPELKVIVSSGYDASTSERFAGKNVTDFLQKPYTTRKLVGTIQSALKGTTAALTAGSAVDGGLNK